MQKRVSTLQLISISERRRYFPDELLFDLIFTHNYYQDFPPASFMIFLHFILYPIFQINVFFKKHDPITAHLEFRKKLQFFFW